MLAKLRDESINGTRIIALKPSRRLRFLIRDLGSFDIRSASAFLSMRKLALCREKPVIRSNISYVHPVTSEKVTSVENGKSGESSEST